MDSWHGKQESCGTTHCLAGWAITLHPRGKEIEDVVGPAAAGALIWTAAGHPDAESFFYSTNEDAFAWLKA